LTATLTTTWGRSSGSPCRGGVSALVIRFSGSVGLTTRTGTTARAGARIATRDCLRVDNVHFHFVVRVHCQCPINVNAVANLRIFQTTVANVDRVIVHSNRIAFYLADAAFDGDLDRRIGIDNLTRRDKNGAKCRIAGRRNRSRWRIRRGQAIRAAESYRRNLPRLERLRTLRGG
jgi:hypothetical protein